MLLPSDEGKRFLLRQRADGKVEEYESPKFSLKRKRELFTLGLGFSITPSNKLGTSLSPKGGLHHYYYLEYWGD